MRKEKKADISSKGISSIQDALEDIDFKVKDSPSEKKFDIRDIFWNYPIFLKTLYKKLIPLSYIIIFGLLVFLFVMFLQSDTVKQKFARNIKKDTFVEGVVGSVNTLNPLFVTNNYIERSIRSLVFENFIYIDKNGEPSPGVAKSWEIKEKGLVYDFVIDDTSYWHDGTKLTVDDVLFTFNTAIALSEKESFDSVGSAFSNVEVEKFDERTIRFKTKEANPLFFRAVSIAIVPKSKLEEVSVSKIAFDPFSKKPMGSGKYELVKIDTGSVVLRDNKYDKYNPEIKEIVFKIYPDSKALENAFRIGDLDAIGSWDREASKYTEEYSEYEKHLLHITDRERIIFLNTRKDSLKDKKIRVVLSTLLNKEYLIKEYNIGGDILNGPIPEDSWFYNSDIDYLSYNPHKAEETLNSLHYKRNENSGYYEDPDGNIFSFSITYFENDSNNRLVSLLVDYYAREGVFIKPVGMSYEQITQEAISTRNFEMLLYEVETSTDPDQYNLWHSLKINYPDLNLSGYEYDRVDILLEEGRQSNNRNTRKQKYDLFQKYLVADAPAIFLYTPIFEYITKSNIEGLDLESINHAYDRFHNIEEWTWK